MTGLRLLHGCGACDDGEIAGFRSRVRFDEAIATAAGELELMDRVVTALEPSDSVRFGGRGMTQRPDGQRDSRCRTTPDAMALRRRAVPTAGATSNR
jgi:hypothetical protein